MGSNHVMVLFLLSIVSLIEGSPIPPSETKPTSGTTTHSDLRQQKSLSFLNFLHNFDSINPQNPSGYQNIGNNLGSSILGTKQISNTSPFNSPIYYIRLPPQPYMFVPGLGYISQAPPPTNSISSLVNVPVNFVSNGKPTTIYQWNGAIDPFEDAPIRPVTTTTPKPQFLPDSPVLRLPGKFNFNGKPEDIYILDDPFPSSYGDLLQNIYP